MSDMIPAGTIVAFAGKKDRVPKGWLLCDGSPLSKNKYPRLFEAIGANWGGDANPTFYLPDLRGKFLRGVSYMRLTIRIGTSDSRPDKTWERQMQETAVTKLVPCKRTHCKCTGTPMSGISIMPLQMPQPEQ